MKVFLFTILLWSLVGPVTGQHKAWRQYTKEDGLPGNIVFDILKDNQQYLWFATYNGIARFNGYEFYQPVDTSIHAGSEAFTLALDNEGKVWFSRLNKSIWFVENDTIRAWKYNDILKSHENQFQAIGKIWIDAEETVWIALNYKGFLKVFQNGTYHFINASADNNVYVTCSGADCYSAVLGYSSSGYFNILLDIHGQIVDVGKLSNHLYPKESYGGAWYLSNGELLISFSGHSMVYGEEKIITKLPNKQPYVNLAETSSGQIIVSSLAGDDPGLYLYASLTDFRQGKGQNLLPGKKVIDVLIDHEDGWWACTLGEGVFYCSTPDVDVYDSTEGLSSSDVLRLTTDGEQFVYCAVRPSGEWAINFKKASIEPLQKPAKVFTETWALYYDTLQHKLWRSIPLQYLSEDQWIEPKLKGISGTIPAKDIFNDSRENQYWFPSPFGFYSMDPVTYEADLNGREIDSLPVNTRTFSVVKDYEGTIWVATMDGLRIWDGQGYAMPDFQHHSLKYIASDLKLLPDNTLVIAYRSGGILIRDRRDSLVHLKIGNGLMTNYISKLYVESENRFFACSDEGLHVIEKTSVGLWEVTFYDNRDGLPSDNVNDVCTAGGRIWVATDKGIAAIQSKSVQPKVKAPVLDFFDVNHRLVEFKDGIQLSHTGNNITFRYHTLFYFGKGEVLYRYRLGDGNGPFFYTTNREINFPNLAPGKYTFEIQGANEAGEFSPSSIWTFEIRPPWWRTWWFLSLGVFILLGSSVWYYTNRLKNLKRDAAQSARIKDLELAALRAQINPHFIFNCLGSIQQFIAENDPQSATRYLARFAKLVRLSLHSSVDGKHSLAEEIEMLDNYLALEKMRFKGRFDYRIDTASDIDPDEIFIAPMLIQPFVENAVVHGVRDKKDKGLIRIEFSLKEKSLHVCISDNGPGFSVVRNGDDPQHKSVGMTLTKNRLQLLSGSSNGHLYCQENLTAADGKIAGAMVIIEIPVG
jgi:ligand-binding sensor domain-containing protein